MPTFLRKPPFLRVVIHIILILLIYFILPVALVKGLNAKPLKPLFLFYLIKHLDRKKFEPIILSSKTIRSFLAFEQLSIKIKFINFQYPKNLNPLVNFLKESKIDIVQSNYYGSELGMAAHLANIPHIWQLGSHINLACSRLNIKNKEFFF